MGLVLRINHLPIDFDIKDSASAFDQFGFDTCLPGNRSRQTGGLRSVISHHTVRDSDLHALLSDGVLKIVKPPPHKRVQGSLVQ